MVRLTNIGAGPLVDNLKEGTLRLSVGASTEVEDSLLTPHIETLVKKRILRKEVVTKLMPAAEPSKAKEVRKQQKNSVENKDKEE